MFLQRYNPWGKTKWDQLQSWNILIFDPQKTDVDECIGLINKLGDSLYSHIAHSDDKEETDIPQPFKGA